MHQWRNATDRLQTEHIENGVYCLENSNLPYIQPVIFHGKCQAGPHCWLRELHKEERAYSQRVLAVAQEPTGSQRLVVRYLLLSSLAAAFFFVIAVSLFRCCYFQIKIIHNSHNKYSCQTNQAPKSKEHPVVAINGNDHRCDGRCYRDSKGAGGPYVGDVHVLLTRVERQTDRVHRGIQDRVGQTLHEVGAVWYRNHHTSLIQICHQPKQQIGRPKQQDADDDGDLPAAQQLSEFGAVWTQQGNREGKQSHDETNLLFRNMVFVEVQGQKHLQDLLRAIEQKYDCWETGHVLVEGELFCPVAALRDDNVWLQAFIIRGMPTAGAVHLFPDNESFLEQPRFPKRCYWQKVVSRIRDQLWLMNDIDASAAACVQRLWFPHL